jgi:hypothetical protein
MEKKISQEDLLQHWVHSHEEDTDTEIVYRPATHKFPRARGRTSFELKPAGQLIEGQIGPTDVPQVSSGTWKLADDEKLEFYRSSESKPDRVMQITALGKDRLVVKK